MEVNDDLMRIGKTSHLTSNRRLIVKMKVKKPPSIGSKVFDNELRHIGQISDIFGSSLSPYVAIKPVVPEPQKLIGKLVYSDNRR